MIYFIIKLISCFKSRTSIIAKIEIWKYYKTNKIRLKWISSVKDTINTVYLWLIWESIRKLRLYCTECLKDNKTSVENLIGMADVLEYNPTNSQPIFSALSKQ